MTNEDQKQFFHEIKDVCDKHGVALVGTCLQEGIPGEIAVMPLPLSDRWSKYAFNFDWDY